MNAEKLKRLQMQVRIGGKGTARRKKKVIHQTTTTDDKKLQSSLKKLSVSTIPGIEEVNIIKDDLTVIHFNNPKAQASLSANTFAVTGHGETKKIVEMLPEILPQLGQETVTQLRMFANAMNGAKKSPVGGGGIGEEGVAANALYSVVEEDDVPMLVSDFDEVAKVEAATTNKNDNASKNSVENQMKTDGASQEISNNEVMEKTPLENSNSNIKGKVEAAVASNKENGNKKKQTQNTQPKDQANKKKNAAKDGKKINENTRKNENISKEKEENAKQRSNNVLKQQKMSNEKVKPDEIVEKKIIEPKEGNIKDTKEQLQQDQKGQQQQQTTLSQQQKQKQAVAEQVPAIQDKNQKQERKVKQEQHFVEEKRELCEQQQQIKQKSEDKQLPQQTSDGEIQQQTKGEKHGKEKYKQEQQKQQKVDLEPHIKETKLEQQKTKPGVKTLGAEKVPQQQLGDGRPEAKVKTLDNSIECNREGVAAKTEQEKKEQKLVAEQEQLKNQQQKQSKQIKQQQPQPQQRKQEPQQLENSKIQQEEKLKEQEKPYQQKKKNQQQKEQQTLQQQQMRKKSPPPPETQKTVFKKDDNQKEEKQSLSPKSDPNIADVSIKRVALQSLQSSEKIVGMVNELTKELQVDAYKDRKEDEKVLSAVGEQQQTVSALKDSDLEKKVDKKPNGSSTKDMKGENKTKQSNLLEAKLKDVEELLSAVMGSGITSEEERAANLNKRSQDQMNVTGQPSEPQSHALILQSQPKEAYMPQKTIAQQLDNQSASIEMPKLQSVPTQPKTLQSDETKPNKDVPLQVGVSNKQFTMAEILPSQSQQNVQSIAAIALPHGEELKDSQKATIPPAVELMDFNVKPRGGEEKTTPAAEADVGANYLPSEEKSISSLTTQVEDTPAAQDTSNQNRKLTACGNKSKSTTKPPPQQQEKQKQQQQQRQQPSVAKPKPEPNKQKSTITNNLKSATDVATKKPNSQQKQQLDAAAKPASKQSGKNIRPPGNNATPTSGGVTKVNTPSNVSKTHMSTSGGRQQEGASSIPTTSITQPSTSTEAEQPNN